MGEGGRVDGERGSMGGVVRGNVGGRQGQKLYLCGAACGGWEVQGAEEERLEAGGTRGMLATDLFVALRRVVNPEVTDTEHD